MGSGSRQQRKWSEENFPSTPSAWARGQGWLRAAPWSRRHHLQSLGPVRPQPQTLAFLELSIPKKILIIYCLHVAGVSFLFSFFFDYFESYLTGLGVALGWKVCLRRSVLPEPQVLAWACGRPRVNRGTGQCRGED